MSEKVVEIAVPLLLPEVQDARDACLERVQAVLQSHRGILKTHLHSDHDPLDLCIHYDPNLVSLPAVRRLAEAAGSELSNGYHHEEIAFSGLDTGDSAMVLAQELENMPGMLHASVSYAAGVAFVAYDSAELSLEEIRHVMRRFGARPEAPAAAPEEGERAHAAPALLPNWLQERWELVLVALGIVFLLIGWVGETFLGLPAAIALVFFLLSYAASGYDTATHAVPAVLNGKFDTDVLMLAAAVGAALLGRWAEGAFLLVLFGIGHAGEHYALDRARSAINALGALMPKTARVRRGAKIVELPVETLALGDVVIVRPGDRIPVDGSILSGESAVDQSPITGELVPVQKIPQDEVFAGTINQEAALEVRVTRLAKDTTLSRIVEMVAEAQAQQSPTQQFVERFTARFVPAVLALTGLVAVVPPIFGWMPFSQSFYRAMLLLVAASPCALAIGTPAAVLAGIARAARSGVLIKGGVHLENLGRLNVIAFDKTGTLTEGRFQVSEVIAMDGANSDEILRLAAAVEQHSNHPLALAIVRAAQERELVLPSVSGLENVPGRGVRSRVGGAPVEIGSLKLFEEDGRKPPAGKVCQTVAELEAGGMTTMIVRRDGEELGVLALSDAPRPDVETVLERLRGLGIRRLVMLTGDNPKVAQRISARVGVTDVKASLLPEDKLDVIRRLQAEYGAVAMVGDGVNDAPALATSTVGIAMGGAGTAVALETADVALMADDLGKLPFAVGLSRASRAIVLQNLAIALGVIALLIVTSVIGVGKLSWTVAAHEGSTVLVALNALRLLGFQLE